MAPATTIIRLREQLANADREAARLLEERRAADERAQQVEAERDAALAKLDQVSRAMQRGEILCSSCAAGGRSDSSRNDVASSRARASVNILPLPRLQFHTSSTITLVGIPIALRACAMPAPTSSTGR